jgi:methyl-accepting chemotaxis protein
MTKLEAVCIVRQAKSSHIRWRAYVQAMLAGIEIQTSQAPLHHKECNFGQWFYRDGFASFAHVEYTHELLHAVYLLIHQALQDGDLGRARIIGEQMVGISYSLVETIDLLQQEIQSAEQEVF